MAGKFWRKALDNQGKYVAEQVNMPQVKIDRPTIVYLGGFLTTNKHPEFAAGSIRRLEDQIQDHPNFAGSLPPIYAWTHADLRNAFNVFSYQFSPRRHISQAGFDISRSTVIPLVSRDGKPLPIEDAKKNLRNLTFFGYSSGSIIAQEVFLASMKMMLDIGYGEKDVRNILREVVLLSVGSASRYSKELDRFTTVWLVATNDRMMRAKNWYTAPFGTLLRNLFTSYGRKKRPMTIRPLSERTAFVTTPVRASDREFLYDDQGNFIKARKFDLLYAKWTLRRSYHELPHYVTRDESNNGFANIASHVLVNALTRTGTPDPLTLVQAPVIEGPKEDVYQKKIEDALRPAPASLT